jgi:hypothetical protein
VETVRQKQTTDDSRALFTVHMAAAVPDTQPNIALHHLVAVLDRTDDVGAVIENTVEIAEIIQKSHKSVVLAPLAKCRTPCHHIYLPIPKGQIHEERRQYRNKCQNNFSASPSSSDGTAQSGIAARYGLGPIAAC